MKKSNEYFNQNSKSEEKRQRLAPHHLKYRIQHRYRTVPNLFHFHCHDLFYRFKTLYFWWSSWLASLSLSCWGICFQNLKWKITIKWKQKKNKTLCQPSKRLAWPIFPHSWSGLVWKRVSPVDVMTMGHSRIIFLCIRPFSARRQPTIRTTKQTTRWSLFKPALDQWEGSLLQQYFIS